MRLRSGAKALSSVVLIAALVPVAASAEPQAPVQNGAPAPGVAEAAPSAPAASSGAGASTQPAAASETNAEAAPSTGAQPAAAAAAPGATPQTTTTQGTVPAAPQAAATPAPETPNAQDPDYAPDVPASAHPGHIAPDNAQAAPAAPAPTAEAAPSGKPLLGALVRAKLDALSKSAADIEREDATALAAFYLARGDQPLWITDGALNDRAGLVIAEIKKAGDWGLDASAFTLPEVTGSLSDESAADAERTLSIAVLTYARHARGGRIPEPAKQLSSYLDRVPQLLDPKDVLTQIASPAAPDATLRGFHPRHPQFEKLRQRYLALLKSADDAAKIVRLPKGPMLKPGQKHPDVALLRERLKVPVAAATADVPADPTLYDDALVTAVKAYQSEKGLTADGLVGATTRAALNDIDLPSPDKIRANMEMWRWVPDDLGSSYVWVNIPEFLVRVVKDGQIIHEERIVTGLPDKQTPVFSAAMELITIHPRWNVPESIKVRELYPSLSRGGTYFQKQGLRMSQNGRPVDPYSIDWSSTDIRKFDVYQPPSANNALGNIKFSFPNKHTVYMHDTPTKGLFNEASRAFSHGCMRVRNPQRLAEIILGNDKGMTPQQVTDLINGPPQENPIQLTTKVPVHMVYFTEWIDDAGEEQRFRDVYGHEQRVMQALAGKWDQIARGPDHLAPVKYPEGSRYASGGGTALDAFFNNLFGGF